jgi:lipopolysaccharide transport protein LptA
VLPAVRISQGDFTVKAKEGRASGLNFENSRWVFNGEVKIIGPDGESNADNAVVVFAGNRIATVDVTGSPATFSQRDPKEGQIARGRAGAIHYDLNANTVRLSDNAWISYGQNELSADSMVYDLAQKSVIAGNSKEGERVHITINPADAKNKSVGPNPTPSP